MKTRSGRLIPNRRVALGICKDELHFDIADRNLWNGLGKVREHGGQLIGIAATPRKS
jgi:hypothetical protein